MKRLVGLLTLLVIVSAGGLVWTQLGHWLSAPDPLSKVDIIAVPSGDPDNRVPKAIELSKDGYGKEIWVGVDGTGRVVPEADAVREYATKAGFGRVRIVGISGSTQHDAKLIARALRRHKTPATIGVVTSPWHVARARITYARILGERARVFAWSDGSSYDAENWWREEPGTTLQEAANLAATLALQGTVLVRGQSIPVSRPLSAAVGGIVGAVLVGALCRPLGRRLGIVTLPRLWRTHIEPTPKLGGLALLAGTAGGVLAGGGARLGSTGAVAAAGVLVLAVVGLIDDVAGLGARTRLFWAAGAGAAAWLLGLRAHGVPGGGAAAELINAGLTVMFFVGVTHALNLLDHVDGVTAGVGAASAISIGAIAAVEGQYVVTVAAAALAGACVGYLFHNFPPARLLMGDMGALALGFSLASLALAVEPGQRPPLSVVVAALVIGVAIFDTTLVTVSRRRSGRSAAEGGTDHTTHRLMARGWSVRRSIAFLWGAQLVCGALALAISVGGRPMAWVITALVAVGGVGALIVFLRMRPLEQTEHREVAEEVAPAVARAVEALHAFDEAATASGLATTDPAVVKAVREGAHRLEGLRSRLGQAE